MERLFFYLSLRSFADLLVTASVKAYKVELHLWLDVQTQSTGDPSFMDYIQTEADDNWYSLSQ